ncbi:carboxymuconolactone decarboxylase family protein [Calderihabitans maritimus]|uniref:Alkylhydroperoxidase n=1 Tax=Calderihabitans maritimus TaxID=1246530 RepID=A0A1Z5HSP6_9FIRM|nr:carboxymuconolactone decarboxylase family protein [Calderihabitans maritimus]GAW92544.1 alkylhydroperoxidase [Calderihabitans maritimus]
MMEGKDILARLEKGKSLLQEKMPEVVGKFQEFHTTVLKEGHLSRKQKTLIALGMALALKCEYCIALHLRTAKELGISLEEIMEVCGIAMLMHGGPGMAYSTLVARIWEEI